jgi:dihydrofolate synthase/folylpolyglutamate synthase
LSDASPSPDEARFDGIAKGDGADALERDSACMRGAWNAPFSLAPEERLGYDEAVERVEAAVRFGIDPSLEPIRALLAELGHPESFYPCVQVAGTNGKTSTSRFAASLFCEAGLKCGLYTSPHLVSYTERVEIDGVPASEAAFAEGVSYALAAWDRVSRANAVFARSGCTEFELLTAAALVIYAKANIDVAVLEVGLGGRWDATSAVATCGCAITGIGFDHMQILGNTLGEIADEKAGVIRAGNPCVLGTNAVRPREVLDVMTKRCREQGVTPVAVVDDATPEGEGEVAWVRGHLPLARYSIAHRPACLGDELAVDVDVCGRAYPAIRLIAPAYQAQNVACAVALVDRVLASEDGLRRRANLDPDGVRRAIASCPVPGRFQVVRREPLAILDACHNPQSAEAFASAVIDAQPEKSKRPVLLFGALADKDHLGIARIVAPLFDRIVVTQSGSPRALSATDLAADVRLATGREPEAVFSSAPEAVRALSEESFVCCGTITLIGEIAELMR